MESTGSKKKILIVERDAPIQDMYARVLGGKYEILTVTDLAEGSRFLTENTDDIPLVLITGQMGPEKGFDSGPLTQRLRQRLPKALFLAMSGTNASQQLGVGCDLVCRKDRVDQLLVKPLTVIQLERDEDLRELFRERFGSRVRLLAAGDVPSAQDLLRAHLRVASLVLVSSALGPQPDVYDTDWLIPRHPSGMVRRDDRYV